MLLVWEIFKVFNKLVKCYFNFVQDYIVWMDQNDMNGIYIVDI